MDSSMMVNIGEERFDRVIGQISFISTKRILSGNGGRLVRQ